MLHFLVAVDGSEHSLAAVRWIAQIAASGASLRCTLLNLQRPIMSGEVGAIAPASVALGERERTAADILEHATSILRPAGVELAQEERMGDAAAVIVARAVALGCDAIVIGRRGLGVFRSALMGSVSSEVVRRSRLPVIIVCGTTLVGAAPDMPLRLLLAVDGSASAKRAAVFVSRLASSAPSEVHLLNIEPVLTLAGSLFGPREKVIEHWSGADGKKALAEARGALDRSGVSYIEHAVASDDPPAAILNAARDNACTSVAMGTRGLGPVKGLLLGSVAQSVLEHAPSAVAAVLLVR